MTLADGWPRFTAWLPCGDHGYGHSPPASKSTRSNVPLSMAISVPHGCLSPRRDYDKKSVRCPDELTGARQQVERSAYERT